jgi:hypothetical protein
MTRCSIFKPTRIAALTLQVAEAQAQAAQQLADAKAAHASAVAALRAAVAEAEKEAKVRAATAAESRPEACTNMCRGVNCIVWGSQGYVPQHQQQDQR